jgi:predicted secreted protein
MTRSIPTRMIALALSAALAACADSTSPGANVTDDQLTADVAGDAADATCSTSHR